MPYINKDLRHNIDTEIDELIIRFREHVGCINTGPANYVISRILLGCLKPPTGCYYDSLSNVIKTLECSKFEIARRLLDRNEGRAILKNGDLEEFENA